MIRALLIAFFLAIAPMAVAAQDRDVRERLIEVLRDDGYREIRISNTFLGRLRFVATKPEMRREIVVNPNTGVILRDYIRFSQGSDDDGPGRSSGASGESGDSPFDDDDRGGTGSSYDDDDDSDDDDSDNGSGSDDSDDGDDDDDDDDDGDDD